MTNTVVQQILFVDISELAQHDSKTGIQRVVRSIVNVLLAQGVGGFRVEFIHAINGEPYRYAHKYIQALQRSPHPARTEDVVAPGAGDIFLGLDFQDTVVPTQADFLQGIRARGTKVYFVVYDLLPIHFRNYFAPATFENHTAWLNTITQSDGAICISKSVSIELLEWLESNRPIRGQPFEIGWFHLGADVEAFQPVRGSTDDASGVLPSLKARPTFLLVATIEPRKGQAQALAAFRLLWQHGIDVNLVVVGKQGWMVDALVADLKESSEVGKRLFWLNDASDEFLAKVYEASTCLIAASEGEGFGLPLIEAAQHDLPIIARDIPVFREVAGTHAFYFSGTEASALADAVESWLLLRESGQIPKSRDMPTLTWAQSASQLLDVVINGKWSTRWISDGNFSCAGSDPRLKTQVGIRRGKSIETTGNKGVFLYGPYLSLPAGDYQVRLHGRIRKLGTSTLTMEATAHFGNQILGTHAFDPAHSDGLIAEMEFHISSAVAEVEFRLWVPAGCEMSINKLEVSLCARFHVDADHRDTSEAKNQLSGGNRVNAPISRTAQSEFLQELLQEDGPEFVEAAFMALLKRPPDATGGRRYLRALQCGTNKLQILYEISSSSECRRAGGGVPGIFEACAQAGIGDANDKPLVPPPAHVAKITRAEELQIIDDIDKFVESAYWVLLKRAPDSAGMAGYKGRLQAGASKTQILFELFTSAECRKIGGELAGLRDAFLREGLHVADEQVSTATESVPTPAKSLTELLSLHGDRFVECAFTTLGTRLPDKQELQHRLQQLHAGVSKIQILSEMAAANGATASNTLPPELSSSVARYRLSQMPILGRFVKLFVEVEGNSAAERRGRAAEQRLVALEAEIVERLDYIEKSRGDASSMKQEALAANQEIDARIASLEKSIVELRQWVEYCADQIADSRQKSARSATSNSLSRIALDLRAAEIARDLRRVG